MSQQALWVRGALLLTIAGFISKVLGMVYRVPLQNIAGDEGLYVYQQIYPILSMAILLSVYSIPSALSHTITSQTNEASSPRLPNTWAVFYLFLGLGALLCLSLWVLASPLAGLMGDRQLTSSIQAASLMFLVMPITALFRGLFQAKALTEYVAVSQVVEQFVRVVGIIVATVISVFYLSAPIYAIGVLASLASVFGVIVAAIFLVIFYNKKLHSDHNPGKTPLSGQFIKVLFLGIVVYSINYVLHLILQTVDVFTMVNLLKQHGYTFEEAKIAKGIFDRSHSMIQLGLVIGSSLALAIIPALNKDTTQQLLAFKWTFLLSLSATTGLIAVMPSLNPLLFMTDSGTFSIQLMMGLVFFISMIVVVSVFLQEYGYRSQQLKWVILMFITKWALNLILIPLLGEMGSSLAYLLAVSVLFVIFLVKWKQLAQIDIPILFCLKTIILTAIMFGVVLIIRFIQPTIDERWLLAPVVLIQCLIGLVVVLIGTYIGKLFTKQEWNAVIGYRFERR